MIDRTDEETTQLVKDWIRRYGLTILAGIVIALVGVFALKGWQERARGKASARSEQLAHLQSAVVRQDLETAEKRYADLQSSNTIQTAMADLLMAKLYHEQRDNAAATQALQRVEKSEDALLAQTAMFSLAQLQVDAGKYDAALTTIASLRGSAYDGELDRLQGDIFLLQEKPREALGSYQTSQKIQPGPLTQLRIDALKARLASNREPVPQKPASVPPHSDDQATAEDS